MSEQNTTSPTPDSAQSGTDDAAAAKSGAGYGNNAEETGETPDAAKDDH